MTDEKAAAATTIDIKDIEIFFPDELKKGAYSNNLVVAHTNEEFILDFMSVAPKTGSVVARIFVSPSHMKRITAALSGAMSKYEELFGEVATKLNPKK